MFTQGSGCTRWAPEGSTFQGKASCIGKTSRDPESEPLEALPQTPGHLKINCTTDLQEGYT